MRVYAIGGALLIVLIELELEKLLWLFRFAEYWIGRAQIQVLHLVILFSRTQTSEKVVFVMETYSRLPSSLYCTRACSQNTFILRAANRGFVVLGRLMPALVVCCLQQSVHNLSADLHVWRRYSSRC